MLHLKGKQVYSTTRLLHFVCDFLPFVRADYRSPRIRCVCSRSSCLLTHEVHAAATAVCNTMRVALRVWSVYTVCTRHDIR